MKKIIITLLLLLLIGSAGATNRTFSQLIDEGYEIEHGVLLPNNIEKNKEIIMEFKSK